MAEMVIMKVVAPSPSSATEQVRNAVASTTLSGSPPTILSRRLTIGSNSPTSSIKPKYRMANMIMTPTGATFLMPLTIIGPIFGAKPPMSAVITGTTISASVTDTRLVMIRTRNVTTVRNPSNANMKNLPLL